MSVVLLWLIPLTSTAVDGHWSVATSAPTLLGVVILLWCSWQLRPPVATRRSAARPAALAVVVAVVPVVVSLVLLAVGPNLAAGSALTLSIVAAGLVLPSRRSTTVLLLAALPIWAVVLTAAFRWAGSGSSWLVVEMVLAVALAIQVIRLRRVPVRAGSAGPAPQVRGRGDALDRHWLDRYWLGRYWERSFEEAFHASPVGVALFDERCTFVRVNPALATLLGRPANELIGHRPVEFGHPDDVHQVDHILAQMAELRSAGETGTVCAERRWVRPDGEIRTGSLSAAPVRGPGGRPWGLFHFQDLTERQHVESALQHSQATLTAVARVARCVQSGEDPRQVLAAEVRWLAQAVSVCILEPAGAGRLVVSFCLGHRAAGAQLLPGSGAPGRIWLSHRSELIHRAGPDDWGFSSMTAPADTATSWWQPLLDDGTVIGVLAVTWDRVVNDVEDPAVQAVRVLAEEAGSVLTAARVRMELETLAETDALTGLVNRRGWQASLHELTRTTQQTGEPLTLALVDLDHLKRYNDTYGHHEGDLLLHHFAARAKAMLRRADVIARWGGEEFAIALPGCAAGDAAPLLDRLRVLVPDGQTCSIGYATLLPTESAAQCLVRADAMLYRAKREGRNRVIGSPDIAGGTSADG